MKVYVEIQDDEGTVLKQTSYELVLYDPNDDYDTVATVVDDIDGFLSSALRLHG